MSRSDPLKNTMELTSTSQEQATVMHPEQSPILQVDFTWKKLKGLITEKGDPKSKPLYIVDCHTVRSPHLVFNSADGSKFGTGTLHAISINADCDLRGRHIKLEAMKRFKTEYSHLSRAFSDGEDPVRMRWTSDADFKTWDFICLDPQEQPVARFSSNVWAVKKLGNIEFLGPKATSEAAREEIVVTGLTLYYCMMLRMNNVLSLFGSVFHKPGRYEKEQ